MNTNWELINHIVEILQLTHIHSLTGPVGQPFASRLGGCSLRPGDAPTLTMEPCSPVSDASLHWWPWRDPWSLATIGPLCCDLTKTLATVCLNNAFPGLIPLLAGRPSPRNTVLGGGEPCGGPAAHLGPPFVSCLTMEPSSPVRRVLLHYSLNLSEVVRKPKRPLTWAKLGEVS